MNEDAGKPNAACAAATRVLLCGQEDPFGLARLERHLERCAECRQRRAWLAQTGADLRAAVPPLDDVRRERMVSRLGGRLDQLAADHARGWVRRVRASSRWMIAGATALAAAAALLLVVRPARIAPRSPGEPSALVRQPSPAGPARAVLQPFALPAAAPTLGERVDHLDVAAGARVRALLGDRARVLLVGPARLEVIAAGADGLEVSLPRGTLVADYDRQRGGRLRIRSPAAVTDVVGTLFSVEAQGDVSRVSVARGHVSVQTDGAPARVIGAGEALTSGAPEPEALAPSTRALLEEHGREVAIPPVAAATALATNAAGTRRKMHAHATSVGGPRPRQWPRSASTAVPDDAPLPVSAPAAVPVAASTAGPLEPVVPAPVEIAAPAPVVTPPPAPTGEALYLLAEAAMKRRDWDGARNRLEEIVARAGRAPKKEIARYELAQLALRAGDRVRAAAYLDELIASDGEPALREPASFLRCELASEAAARRCWTDFRSTFPASVHDEAALGQLIGLAAPDETCGPARPLLDEYLRRYPAGPSAAAAAQRRAHCTP